MFRVHGFGSFGSIWQRDNSEFLLLEGTYTGELFLEGAYSGSLIQYNGLPIGA